MVIRRLMIETGRITMIVSSAGNVRRHHCQVEHQKAEQNPAPAAPHGRKNTGSRR
jgi:hypothetical protein